MTLYLDVIWVLNFCIDYLLIWLTALALKRRIKHLRFFLASFVASSYVLLLFVPDASTFTNPVTKLIFSFFLMYIAFGYQRLTFLIKNVAMFYFVSFVAGGGLFAVHYFLQQDAVLDNGIMTTKGTGLGDKITWVFVVTGFPVLWYFSKRRMEDIKVEKLNFFSLAKVQIDLNGITICGTGLVDSGNKLHDPISKMPVMILDMNCHGQLFPLFIQELAKDYTMIGQESLPVWEEKLRLVPFRSVGHQQFLTCVKPDQVTIISDGKTYVTKNALVGLSQSKLSPDGQYDCIVHPEMLLENVQALTASSF